MKELIEKVSAEAGVTPEQAQKAIESVSAYMKNKTPHVFHEQLDVIINGGTLSDAMKKKMSDLKDDISDAARNIGQKAEELINDVFGKKS